MTAGIALLGVLARYLRRRKSTSNVTYRKLPRNPQLLQNPNGGYELLFIYYGCLMIFIFTVITVQLLYVGFALFAY